MSQRTLDDNWATAALEDAESHQDSHLDVVVDVDLHALFTPESPGEEALRITLERQQQENSDE